jgi:hypothetical protein
MHSLTFQKKNMSFIHWNGGSSIVWLPFVWLTFEALVAVKTPYVLFFGYLQVKQDTAASNNVLPPFLDIRCIVFYEKFRNIRFIMGLWGLLR